jgi:hypothetical protein
MTLFAAAEGPSRGRPYPGPATPSRFGADRAWAERAARRLRLVAGPGAQPTESELDALRSGLTRRDEPAAALIRAGLKIKDLHRAVAAGPSPDAPEPVRLLRRRAGPAVLGG